MRRWAIISLGLVVTAFASHAEAAIITGASTVQAESAELPANGECALAEVGTTKEAKSDGKSVGSWTPEARQEDSAVGKIVALLMKREPVPRDVYEKAPSQLQDMLDEMHLVAGREEEGHASVLPASPGYWRPAHFSAKELSGIEGGKPGNLSQIPREKLSEGSMELPVPGGGEARSLADLEKWFGLKEK